MTAIAPGITSQAVEPIPPPPAPQLPILDALATAIAWITAQPWLVIPAAGCVAGVLVTRLLLMRWRRGGCSTARSWSPSPHHPKSPQTVP